MATLPRVTGLAFFESLTQTEALHLASRNDWLEQGPSRPICRLARLAHYRPLALHPRCGRCAKTQAVPPQPPCLARHLACSRDPEDTRTPALFCTQSPVPPLYLCTALETTHATLAPAVLATTCGYVPHPPPLHHPLDGDCERTTERFSGLLQ